MQHSSILHDVFQNNTGSQSFWKIGFCQYGIISCLEIECFVYKFWFCGGVKWTQDALCLPIVSHMNKVDASWAAVSLNAALRGSNHYYGASTWIQLQAFRWKLKSEHCNIWLTDIVDAYSRHFLILHSCFIISFEICARESLENSDWVDYPELSF